MTDRDVLAEARTLREEWLSSAVAAEVYWRTRPLIDCMAKLAAEVERLRGERDVWTMELLRETFRAPDGGERDD